MITRKGAHDGAYRWEVEVPVITSVQQPGTSKIGSSSNARVSVTLSRVAGDGGDDGIVIVGWKEIQGW